MIAGDRVGCAGELTHLVLARLKALLLLIKGTLSDLLFTNHLNELFLQRARGLAHTLGRKVQRKQVKRVRRVMWQGWRADRAPRKTNPRSPVLTHQPLCCEPPHPSLQ